MLEPGLLKDKILVFDGAMGTVLQTRDVPSLVVPETLNITHSNVITTIHKEYIAAGADIITTNTFGANRFKAELANVPLKNIITSAINNAKNAVENGKDKFIALDIGPSGKVMKPYGTLDFDEAIEVFAEIIRLANDSTDLILLETFTDLYELKAAIIAAKENSSLPIFASMSFDEHGKTFFGATPETMVLTLEALGVSALGVNCSLGPKQLAPIVKKLTEISSIPVFVQPNAGLPVLRDGKTTFDVSPTEFAEYARSFVGYGVNAIGGCCGTTPAHIQEVKKLITNTKPIERSIEKFAGVCSASRYTDTSRVLLVGESINPTGKKILQKALRENDIEYIISIANSEVEAGADVLDINLGLPDIDEIALQEKVITKIQAISNIPLQIDTANFKAMERAARIYNGKTLLNSVNGKQEVMDEVFPIAKKYGCAVLGLTLDDNGLPKTAEARFEIAKTIVKEAQKYGIAKEDIFIDCLMLSVSAMQNQANETLKALSMVKTLGVNTILGISNVSFGLPQRPLLNRTMLTAAISYGLDAAIMNPLDSEMQDALYASQALFEKDENAAHYIARFKTSQNTMQASNATTINEKKQYDLITLIVKGIAQGCKEETQTLLQNLSPLTVIEEKIIPALDKVGELYEKGDIFLPGLIKSAEVAGIAFEVVRSAMKQITNGQDQKRPKFVIATVRGDIHDIGKNIVKTILENYNFDVIDLGKDVSQETILAALEESKSKLLGLSALMTTTVTNMKNTIEFIRSRCNDVKIIVGGAVLTEELAAFVGADAYASNAPDTVKLAQKFLKE
ncbi:MAG: homocysteine S-methyltransferase family protein [Synergistaceae bacterium]|nr:homocysteine S-methyltransferase family protein [Synergistaceae bacterium]